MPESYDRAAVKLSLLGANPEATVEGRNPKPTKAHYLVGRDPSRWRRDVPSFGEVVFENVYPSISMVFHGMHGELEFDFELAPGANPDLIRIRFDGAESVSISPEGDLLLDTRVGQLRQHKPSVFQAGPLGREIVNGRHVLRADGSVAFELEAHDPTRATIIDPVLSYATYLGGSGTDGSGFGVVRTLATALDEATGVLIIASGTTSLDFPTTPGAFQEVMAGYFDVFVTAMAPQGDAPLFSTYLGGSAADSAAGVALDAQGNVYVAGSTWSADFPIAGSPYQDLLSGLTDGFVSKLDPTGSSLIYSTYFGGDGYTCIPSCGSEVVTDLAVSSTGEAFATGFTDDPTFPITPGAFDGQVEWPAGADGFVTRLNATGSSLVYSTFLGGSGIDEIFGIVIAPDGTALVGGYTHSADFPTENAFQASLAGDTDAFLTRVSVNGDALVFSSYLGGAGVEEALDVAVDEADNMYATGITTSTDFPVTPGAYQQQYLSSIQFPTAFVTKVGASGTLAYSTYLGGSTYDWGLAVAVHDGGHAYVGGWTTSADFPIADPLVETLGQPGARYFLTELDTSGCGVRMSTWLATGGTTNAYDHEIDASCNTHAAGAGLSLAVPTTPGAFQESPPGGVDAFAMRIGTRKAPGMSVYILSGGNYAADQAVVNALTSEGHLPTLGVEPWQWDGTQADLESFDAVLFLNNFNEAQGDMPESGQTAILNFVNGGGGLVTGEWTLWNASQAHFALLEPLFPAVSEDVSLAGQATYSRAVPDCRVGSGLVPTFAFGLTTGSFGTESILQTKAGATVFYGNDQGGDGVVGWTFGQGRVASFSTLIADVELSTWSYARLLANAVEWAATSGSADVEVAGWVASPDPAMPGQPITFTATVTNSGPREALGVALYDSFPPGVMFLSADTSQGSCSYLATTVSCTLGSLAPGASATVAITVVPLPLGQETVTNRVHLTGYLDDPDPCNNSASVTVEIVEGIDVAIEKSATSDEVNFGEQLVYGLAVFNFDNEDPAEEVVVHDYLPATIVGFLAANPSQGSCTEVSGQVECLLGTIEPGGGATVEITVEAIAPGTGTNTATVEHLAPDPVPSNNTDSVQTTVQSIDLDVSQSDAPDPAQIGQEVTYTVTVTNLGAQAATNTFFGSGPRSRNGTPDVISATVVGGAGDECRIVSRPNGEVAQCSLGTIEGGSAKVVQVVATLPVAGTMKNKAQVSAVETDPFPTNNESIEETVIGIADLSVTIADAPDPVGVGQPLTYTITVSNDGPDPVADGGMIHAFPARWGMGTVSWSNGSCDSGTAGRVICTYIVLGAGQSTTGTVVVTPTFGRPDPIPSSVAVGSMSDQYDPNYTNNMATTETTVSNANAADLAVTLADAPDPGQVGQPITYSASVSNLGPANATDLVLTFQYPAAQADFDPEASDPTCSSPTPGTVECTHASLESGASRLFDIVLVPSLGGTLRTRARVRSGAPDPTPGNNLASAQTEVIATADLSITKTADPGTVGLGEQVVFTLMVSNAGPDPAGAVLRDVVPDGLFFLNVTPPEGCDTTELPSVTCNLGTLDSGQGETVMLTVRADAVGTVRNTARVATNATDPQPGNNSASAVVTVTGSADLSLTLSDSPDPVSVGQALTYTAAVSNLGPDPALPDVVDQLPASAVFVSAESSDGASCTYLSGQHSVRCSLKPLAVGSIVTVNIVVTPQAAGTIESVSRVLLEADPNKRNNKETESTTVLSMEAASR
ncbi:MAG: DUF11 domain-containing protein [Nitrospirae bacterium]|nr:DUF11 domain-containing protein [Nitrospirota bacterium]